MDSLIRGLHHVTATVADAQEDLDFYTKLLGQRLVKKTVNFDNHYVYHFYYGNEVGAPGTIMTTFPYTGMGVRPGAIGAGQIAITSFSTPAAALGFWRARLAEHGVPCEDNASAFGEETLTLRDPSGLIIRIVGAVRDDRAPWTRAGIDAAHAIRGIFGVTLLVREPKLTMALLTESLNGAVLNESGDTTRVGISGGAPGGIVEIVNSPNAPHGVNGLGTVHHVAFAVGDDEGQLAKRDELVNRGLHVTEVLDREYFHSIYFREPNGVLFEVATLPPGFTVDEKLGELGSALKLPSWEEPYRADIEAGLPRVSH